MTNEIRSRKYIMSTLKRYYGEKKYESLHSAEALVNAVEDIKLLMDIVRELEEETTKLEKQINELRNPSLLDTGKLYTY